MLHPIHYSLLVNALIIAVSGGLAWLLANPLVFVIGLMVLQHMPGRFEDDDEQATDAQGGQPMGFVG